MSARGRRRFLPPISSAARGDNKASFSATSAWRQVASRYFGRWASPPPTAGRSSISTLAAISSRHRQGRSASARIVVGVIDGYALAGQGAARPITGQRSTSLAGIASRSVRFLADIAPFSSPPPPRVIQQEAFCRARHARALIADIGRRSKRLQSHGPSRPPHARRSFDGLAAMAAEFGRRQMLRARKVSLRPAAPPLASRGRAAQSWAPMPILMNREAFSAADTATRRCARSRIPPHCFLRASRAGRRFRHSPEIQAFVMQDIAIKASERARCSSRPRCRAARHRRALRRHRRHARCRISHRISRQPSAACHARASCRQPPVAVAFFFLADISRRRHSSQDGP